MMALVLWCAMLVAICGGGCAVVGPGPEGFPRGVVAADHADASEAGAAMLRAGGNAVDAAVATSFALSVVRPYSCGIGGGGFMVVYLRGSGREGRAVAIDYREVAPATMRPDFFESEEGPSSTTGASAVGVPGTVAGLLYALERYGTMEREQVLAPAIALAERGFVVDEHYVESVRPLIRRFRGEGAGRSAREEGARLRERYSFVWKRFLREGEVQVGDVIALPEQAEALRLIAAHGAQAFYEGPIAEAIVRAVERDGGGVGMEDLGSYWVRERVPLVFAYAGHRFYTMPPPSSGGVAMAQALGILGRIGEKPGGAGPRAARVYVQDAARAHALVESFKHAFADRAEWLGDSDFVNVPIGRLLSAEYLDERAAVFDRSRTLSPGAYGTREGARSAGAREDSGTSHLSVVDRWGNAVACTETINLTFGSLLAVEEYGFILNNEMDDFTTRRGEANAFGLRQSDRNLPAPRKRPLSSMTPTVVVDESNGRVEVVAGASGGPRIITATTQVILNALSGMNAMEAVEAPRLHHQWAPDRVQLEAPLADVTQGAVPPADGLRARGHRVEVSGALANVQVIVRSNLGWTAASDPRKGGRPAGH